MVVSCASSMAWQYQFIGQSNGCVDWRAYWNISITTTGLAFYTDIHGLLRMGPWMDAPAASLLELPRSWHLWLRVKYLPITADLLFILQGISVTCMHRPYMEDILQLQWFYVLHLFGEIYLYLLDGLPQFFFTDTQVSQMLHLSAWLILTMPLVLKLSWHFFWIYIWKAVHWSSIALLWHSWMV